MDENAFAKQIRHHDGDNVIDLDNINESGNN